MNRDSITISKKYLGGDADRLKGLHGGSERIYAKAWENSHGHNTLSSLLRNWGGTSKRDRFVANTVIQWLGTSVGRGFLYEVERLRCKYCDGVAYKEFAFENGTKKCPICKGTGFSFKGDGKIKGIICEKGR